MNHWIVEAEKCKMCGKLSYESCEDAKYAGRSYSVQVYPYKCQYGKGWHLSRTRKVKFLR